MDLNMKVYNYIKTHLPKLTCIVQGYVQDCFSDYFFAYVIKSKFTFLHTLSLFFIL